MSPAHHKILMTMIRSHQSTLQLVETVLNIYRNDTEGLKLQLVPVDLVTIAEEAIATLTDLASSRQVYITLGFEESDFRKVL